MLGFGSSLCIGFSLPLYHNAPVIALNYDHVPQFVPFLFLFFFLLIKPHNLPTGNLFLVSNIFKILGLWGSGAYLSFASPNFKNKNDYVYWRLLQFATTFYIVMYSIV